MRKIQTGSDERKKKKRNQFIVGVVLILVMVLSTFGIVMDSLGGSEKIQDKINYNGFIFNLKNNLWQLEIGDYKFSFYNNPAQVENLTSYVSTNLSKLNNYVSQPLYISSQDYTSNSEIYTALSPFVERVQLACHSNESCTGDYPIKNCDNNFIIISESNQTSIYQQDKCVFISGPKQELIKLTDLFLFKILGIKE
jgi:hypothetical protein